MGVSAQPKYFSFGCEIINNQVIDRIPSNKIGDRILIRKIKVKKKKSKANKYQSKKKKRPNEIKKQGKKENKANHENVKMKVYIPIF